MIRGSVLLVDDDALFRRGLRRLLEHHDVEVIGEGSHGRAAVQLASELRSDIVIIGLSLPLMYGLEAIQRIVAADPGVSILALTHGADENDVLDALLTGACGYLVKDARSDEIMAGVREAASTEGLFMAPEGGACVAALRKLRSSGHLSADDSVVVFNTGTGLKYTDVMAPLLKR